MKIFRRGDHTKDGFAAGNQNPKKRGLILSILGKSSNGSDEAERNKGDDWTRRSKRR